MKGFEDHFSARAPLYARYRPRYPDSLFTWLAAITPSRRRAWDCATGSGQAAVSLCRHFDLVIATDASTSQIAPSLRAPGPVYAAMTAERAAIANGSVALVTIAQALHWFDAGAFFGEAQRVLEPRGVIAAWSYGLCSITPSIDRVIERFYADTLKDYWPPERAMVDDGYASVTLPIPEIAAPPFTMEARWSLEHMLGYLSTWSAVTRFAATTGKDAMASLAPELGSLWPDAETARLVRWTLTLRVGRAE